MRSDGGGAAERTGNQRLTRIQMSMTTPTERVLGDSLTTAMVLAMAIPQPEISPMPCRSLARGPLPARTAVTDERHALRTRIADLEDLLALVDATEGGPVRRVLSQCLEECRRKLSDHEQPLLA